MNSTNMSAPITPTQSIPPPESLVVTYTQNWTIPEPWVLVSTDLPTVAIAFASSDKASALVPSNFKVILAGSTQHLWQLQSLNTDADTHNGAPNPSTSVSETSSPAPTSSAIASPPSSAASHTSSISQTNTLTTSASQALVAFPSSQLPSGTAGLKPSHTAGLAIGCIIAGAFIAMAAACLIARRRRRRAFASPARSRFRSAAADSDPEKRSSSTILRHIEKQPLSPGFDLLLAPPLPESELLAMFKRLKDLIASHVERYLDSGENMTGQRPDQSFNQRLSELLGPGCLVSPQNLGTLLLEPRTQAIGAKYLIARVILSNIDSSGPPETTLLTPELSECMASMAGMKSEAQGMTTILLNLIEHSC